MIVKLFQLLTDIVYKQLLYTDEI